MPIVTNTNTTQLSLHYMFSQSCQVTNDLCGKHTKIKECHRRDGFEVGNADKIFESTSMDQLTRRTV